MIPLWDQDHGWRGKSQLVAPFRSASQTHLALRLFRQPKWQGPGPTDCSLCRLPLPLIPRGSDGGQVLHRLKAWAKPCGCPWWGLWSPAGHSPQPVLWPPRLPAGLRAGGLEVPGEQARIPLLPHCLTEDHHSLDLLLNGLTDSGMLVERAQCGSDQRLNRTINSPLVTIAWLCGEGDGGGGR